MNRKRETQKKTPATRRAGKDTADAGGGTGRATGGRYDEKRNPPFPESAPPYAGDHTSMDFDASRQGADVSVPTTDSGVSSAAVDEFTTGGNSLGRNAGASLDKGRGASKTARDRVRRPVGDE